MTRFMQIGLLLAVLLHVVIGALVRSSFAAKQDLTPTDGVFDEFTPANATTLAKAAINLLNVELKGLNRSTLVADEKKMLEEKKMLASSSSFVYSGVKEGACGDMTCYVW